MKYKISKKTYGTNNIESFANIVIEEEITDACWVDGAGLVYACKNYLGLISEGGQHMSPWIGGGAEVNFNTKELDRVSAISYLEKNKLLFVAEKGGRKISVIDFEKNYTYQISEGAISETLNRLLKKAPEDSKVYLAAAGREQCFLTFPRLKKCYFLNGSDIHHVAGDGKCRFANGVDAKNSSIGMPSGMTVNKGRLLLADSLKNLVRSFDGNNFKILCGHPKENILDHPSKLSVQNDTLYIACKDGVKAYSFLNDKCGESLLYKSDSLYGVVSPQKGKDLYILEEEHG